SYQVLLVQKHMVYVANAVRSKLVEKDYAAVSMAKHFVVLPALTPKMIEITVEVAITLWQQKNSSFQVPPSLK
ncbi:2560_t:CDS:2, partial [Acaulospora colombiana]